MDWLYVLMPIAGIKVFWPGLIILGVGVGIIGGFFGMGGAWMVTPGLNILGLPMAFAIGTDFTHMAGKSLISTMRHAKFGNVDYKLAFIMVFGTIAGVEVGARNIMWLERIGQIDLYVRIGIPGTADAHRVGGFRGRGHKKVKEREAVASKRTREWIRSRPGIEWHKTMQKIRIPPMVHLKKAADYLLPVAADRSERSSRDGSPACSASAAG